MDKLEIEWVRLAVRHLYEEFNITFKPIVYLVAVMAAFPEMDYWDVLIEWSRHAHKILRQPSLEWMNSIQWHSELCYRVMKSGAEPEAGLEKWFEDRAKEVRELAD